MRERLIGRRDEIGVLETFLDAPASGWTATAIEGEAGIGKTSVWREGVERARGRGFRVLLARPTGSEVRLSFAGLGDLLAPVAAEVLPGLPAPQRRALGAALLLEEPGGPPDPRAVGVAVLEVLRVLARREPVLVAVDDLQWLDVPSGQLLAFALRRLGDERVLLLAAIRTEQGTGVPFELDRALGDGRLRRVPLGPLSLGALYQLLRTRLELSLPRALLVRVHESSGGNPFFALELGRELARRGIEHAADEPLSVPEDLASLLRRRLERLPSGARSLLLTVAASARPTVALLEAASASPEEAAAGLEHGLRAGLVELEGDEIRFTHPALASVCYSVAPPRRRRHVHARLAEVVDDPEARARHLALAGEAPDEKVALALEDAAATATARGAAHAAAELWALSASATPPERDGERRRRMLTASDARLKAGDLAGARALVEELIAATPSGVERGELLLRLAQTRDDDVQAAAELCERALAEAPEDGELGARVYHYLAAVHTVGGDIRRGLEYARRALELAEAAASPELVAVTLAGAAWHELWAGEVTPGLLERAVEVEESVASPVPLTASAATALGCSHMYSDRLDEGRVALERQVAKATAAGDEISTASLLRYLAQLECRAGNWERADRLASEVVELFERRGLEQQGSTALYTRALVDAHLGRADESRAAAEEGLRIALASGDLVFELHSLGVLGFLDLSLGDVEAAAHRLGDLPERLLSGGWNEPAIFPVWPNAIEALVGVGELERARRYLAAYEQRAETSGGPFALATAARCRGLLAAAEGDRAAAREAFARALIEHARMPRPFERARTLFVLGGLERRAKQKRAAREALEEALAVFDELGARLWSARTRDELARLGGRPPAAAELTDAEWRVAELVAEGRTNRETAAALFLSEHTIESHLRSVYRKLDVRSRTELARRFPAGERQGSRNPR